MAFKERLPAGNGVEEEETAVKNTIGKTTRGGHKAHTRMGLPRGNPLAGGGNVKSGGRRRSSAAPSRRTRRSSY